MKLNACVRIQNSRYLENPIWSKDDNNLYFIDIKSGCIYLHDLGLNRTIILHKFNEQIGGISIEESGIILAYGSYGRIYSLNLKKRAVELFMVVNNVNTRFNEIFVLRDSTVLAGVMPSANTAGKILHIQSKNAYEVLLDGLTTPNGFAYNGQNLLITDTQNKKILKTTNKPISQSGQYQTKVFCDLKDFMGFPDGLIKTDDIYISANNGSNSLTYISKIGDIIGSLYLGEFQPTSLCLAETNPKQLIVTTKADSNGISNILFINYESAARSEQYRSELSS